MLLHQEFIKNAKKYGEKMAIIDRTTDKNVHLRQGPDRLADPGRQIQQIPRRLHRHHGPHLGRLHALDPRRAHGRQGAGDDQLFHRGGQQRRVRPEKMRLQDHHRLPGAAGKDRLPRWSRAWSSSRTSWRRLGPADKVKALLEVQAAAQLPAESGPPGRARRQPGHPVHLGQREGPQGGAADAPQHRFQRPATSARS